MTGHSDDAAPVRANLTELATFFTRLGFTAFGGPAAHIAMIQDEVVERRRWVSKQHFVEIGAEPNITIAKNQRLHGR